MSGAKAVWWCSWLFPFELCASTEIAAKWPAGVKGWCSGESETEQIWCARVEAPTRDAAIALVGTMYGSLAQHLRWRFGPDSKPDGWWPESSRFPRGAL